MSKRVSNKKGQQRVRPARSRRAWQRHVEKVWQRRQRFAEQARELDRIERERLTNAGPTRRALKTQTGIMQRVRNFFRRKT